MICFNCEEKIEGEIYYIDEYELCEECFEDSKSEGLI